MDNQRQAVVTELDLAFMAGLFAGEGSICIVVGKFPNGERYPNMHAGFATTERCWADWFHEAFGGTKHIYPPKKETNKFIFFWRVGGQAAENFLKAIRPYLKGEKVKQLELALRYREAKRQCKAAGEKISQKTDLWDGFKAELKALRRAAAETNRTDASHTQSDSPTPQVTAD